MIDELFFKAAFFTLWTVFLCAFVWFAHSTKWTAGRRTTQRAKRLRAIALAFAFLYLVDSFLYALLPNSAVFLYVPLTNEVRLSMICVTISGLAFLLWALRTLGSNWAPSLSGMRQDTSLITNGPYKIVRHPIYLGVVVILLALGILSANVLILMPTAMLVVLLYMQLPDEESMLIERFGDAYLEYMKRTPKFIPRLFRNAGIPADET